MELREENGVMVNEKGERMFKISEGALVLTFVNHIVSYAGEDTSPEDKMMIKMVATQLGLSLFESHKDNTESKDKVLIIFLNYAAKLLEIDELETLTAPVVLKYADGYGQAGLESIQTVLKMNPEEFFKMEQEGQFQLLFYFISMMEIDVEKAYKELDILEADVTNQPVYTHS